MKKLTIKLNLDERKYDALHTFSTQKGIDIDAEFVAYFEKMYKKIVPKAVREYIEGTTLSTVSDPVSEEKVIHNDPQLQPEPEPETKSNPISNPGGFSKARQNLSNWCLFRMQDKASPPNWW